MTAEFPTAVHALVYLHHKGAVVPSAELADNICTNPARVRKIMAALCRAGLAFATEGRASGYHTGPEAGAVTLRQVADALGEVPVLGNLFKSRARKEKRRELLIFITPRIMDNMGSTLRY